MPDSRRTVSTSGANSATASNRTASPRPTGNPFAFAGLWERWEQDGQVLESGTILVTQANALIAPLHDRMPVILDPAAEARWLDPAVTDPAALRPLLAPCPVERLRLWPVGTAVNATRHDGPDLMAPVTLPAV